MKKTHSIKVIVAICLLNAITFAQSNNYVEVPFEIDNGQIIVDATLKEEKAKFVLSTVLPSSIDFNKFDKRRLVNNQKMYRNNLNNSYTPVAVVSGLKLGDLKIYKLDMYWDGASSMVYKTSQEVDGILGYNFFDDRIIQINYAKKIIRIYKENPYNDKIKSDSNTDASISILKIKNSTETPPKEKSYTTIKNVQINGNDVKILVDINQPSKFLIPLESKTLLNSSNQIENFKLGTFEFMDFKTEIVDELENSKKYDAVLGSEFFQDYIITLDSKKNYLILESVGIKE